MPKTKSIAVLIMACLGTLFPAVTQEHDHPLTREEIESIKTAILDEIYDYDYQGAYIDITGLTPSGYTIPIYIRPNLIQGSGQVIYKLPIGEVSRVFQSTGHLLILFREPRDKFPPTSGSTLTLYLKDEDICAAKRNWIRETLSIKPQPSKSEVEAAVMRERQRKGTSQHDETTKSHK